jgi:AraC-like DNA-binding protein
MRVLRDAEIVSGFTIDQPFSGLRTITHCGEALCSKSHRLATHTHHGIELMYLVSGAVSWVIDGVLVRQSAGELCVVGSGRPHRTASVAHPEFKALYVGLDLSTLGRIGAVLKERLDRSPARNFGRFPEVEPVIRGVFQQSMSRLAKTSEIPRRYADLLVALLSAKIDEDQVALAPRAHVLTYPMQKAIHFLERNLHRRVPLTELARTAHLCDSHFAICFRGEVGIPPAAHHRQLRLEAARNALHTPGSTIVSVANEFGFSSSQHFSTLFRRSFGFTPRQWVKDARPLAPKGWQRLKART